MRERLRPNRPARIPCPAFQVHPQRRSETARTTDRSRPLPPRLPGTVHAPVPSRWESCGSTVLPDLLPPSIAKPPQKGLRVVRKKTRTDRGLRKRAARILDFGSANPSLRATTLQHSTRLRGLRRWCRRCNRRGCRLLRGRVGTRRGLRPLPRPRSRRRRCAGFGPQQEWYFPRQVQRAAGAWREGRQDLNSPHARRELCAEFDGMACGCGG